MKYLLDINVCIGVINERSKLAEKCLRSLPPDETVVCSVTRAELFYGSSKSQTPELTRRKQDYFLKPFATLPFDDAAASVYGRIRAELERVGTPIGAMDTQIAAIALVHGLIVVTHNTREFSRITGLALEDWEMI